MNSPGNDLFRIKDRSSTPWAIEKDVGLLDGRGVAGTDGLGPEVEAIGVTRSAEDVVLIK
jgi:hypothetical protein